MIQQALPEVGEALETIARQVAQNRAMLGAIQNGLKDVIESIAIAADIHDASNKDTCKVLMNGMQAFVNSVSRR